jgi:DUF3048 family protein/Big-like domain-containing protein
VKTGKSRMRPGKSPVITSRGVTNITRARVIIAAVALLVVLAASFGAVTIVFAAVHGELVLAHPDHVWTNDPIAIKFDQDVDTSNVKVSLIPKSAFTLKRTSNQLVVAPKPAWLPGRHYTIQLGSLPNSRHTSTLTGWHAIFLTQPDVDVKAFKAASGVLPAGGQANVRLRSSVLIEFTQAMDPAKVKLTVNGEKPPTGTLSWSADKMTATFTPAHPQPSQTFQVAVASGFSATGDPMLRPAKVQVTTYGLEPSNGSSGIGPDYVTVPPIEIVIENSGPARPQIGFQQADMVYEYISEYNISRMTAFYFNRPPSLIGPVRSCRLINPFLNFSFDGLTMCSGASRGTLHVLFSEHVPITINDFDTANHFFRVNFKFAPHNLYTDASRALVMRIQWPLPPPNYTIDPPHPDNGLGQPAAAPSVPLHNVSYTYNPTTQLYARFDHGTPFVEAGTNAQLQVKNVIMIHVPFAYANYVEDESGGAHGVDYGMLGQGPAEIYSDGKLIAATWHMDQHSPMYFTDAAGNFIELNTGLTWIHVLGNGQTQ